MESSARSLPLPRVGADPLPGLVWGYRFDADGRATRLARAVDPAVIDEARDAGDWLWLHFALDDTRTGACIARLPLPAAASASLFERDAHVSLDLDGDAAWG